MSEGNKLREGLPPLPPMMRDLPIDWRGYPVPRFVHVKADGTPDHRVAEPEYLGRAVRERLCWICGHQLASGHFAFLTGPVSLFTRVSPEPPMHAACATYAARSCPFLSHPQAQRRDAGLPAQTVAPPGEMLTNNPSITLHWLTRTFHMEMHRRGDGVLQPLFFIGEPLAILWYAQARFATPQEVAEAVAGAMTRLELIAAQDGGRGAAELAEAVERAGATLDRLAVDSKPQG